MDVQEAREQITEALTRRLPGIRMDFDKEGPLFAIRYPDQKRYLTGRLVGLFGSLDLRIDRVGKMPKREWIVKDGDSLPLSAIGKAVEDRMHFIKDIP